MQTTEQEMGALATIDNLKAFVDASPSMKHAGEKLGVSGSAVSRWLKSGICPLSIDLACQNLLGNSRTIFFYTFIHRGDPTAIEAVLSALNVTFTKEQLW
jgi:hypothetical protein